MSIVDGPAWEKENPLRIPAPVTWPEPRVPAAPLVATPEGDKGPALARQEGGGHYKGMAIQPFEYIHANRLGFAEGCVVKYVSRWRAKGGVEDLKKARHFLDLLIEAEQSAQKP
jgi:hypothetical protein